MTLRLVFMGTPDFAVPTLTEIVGQGHEVAAVYTQPPRPAGRGMADSDRVTWIAAQFTVRSRWLASAAEAVAVRRRRGTQPLCFARAGRVGCRNRDRRRATATGSAVGERRLVGQDVLEQLQDDPE